MSDKEMQNLHAQSIPEPYLVAATDQYYGVAPVYEERRIKNRKRTKTKKKSKGSKKGKKLRILITTYWDYPAVGGLQNYITTLKDGLEKLGHVVEVLAPNNFPNECKKLKKIIIKETKKFYSDRYGCYNEKIVKENQRLCIYEMVLRNMDLEQYDIFHAQDRFTANILGRVNQYYQKPLFFTPHGFMTQRKLEFNLIEKGSVEAAYYLSLDQKAIESTTHTIILCEAFRPALKNLGAKKHNLTTVYTGIDFKAKSKKKTKMEHKEKIIVTCISRLRPRKGHKYLFEALALIKSELKNVEVWVVGDGEMRDKLDNQVQTLGLNNVSFLGERNNVPELLSKTDIYVLPTTSDTLPIAIIEAMLANKAIITTNIGGIPEIIQNYDSGLIVEPGNSEQLAEKISLLLRDVELREDIAQNANAFAKEHLTSENMTKKIEKIYQFFHKEEA